MGLGCREVYPFGHRNCKLSGLAGGIWFSQLCSTTMVVLFTRPRTPPYTRGFQDSVAFYKPMEGNTKTDLTIMCRIDLNDTGEDGSGGSIPMWLYVKTIGFTAVQSMVRMRKAILDDIKEKRIVKPDYSPSQ